MHTYINTILSVIAIVQATSSRCPTAGPRFDEKSIGLGFEFEKVAWGRISPSSMFFPANSHSANRSILINHPNIDVI
jgi:hypothetical protein